jgi:hypothetical protein
VDAGAPKAPPVDPNGELVAAPPKGLDVVVVFAPKPGLFCPNNPLPVFDPPNGDDCVAVVEAPNPPKPPVDPAVAVPLPNKLLVVVAGVPNPPGFAPNALFVGCGVPKAPGDNGVSIDSVLSL